MRQIYIVDDDASFLETACMWLESLDYSVAAFNDPQAFIEDVSATPLKDVAALLDVRMPEMSGLQVIRTLNAKSVRLPIIFVTGHGDVPLAVEAMREGAVTFLEKPLDPDALEKALELAFSDTAGMTGHYSEELKARYETLTNRQREIFEHVVQGKMNKIIAADLDISIKTVELHRKHMMEKMQAHNLPHLLRMNMIGDVLDDPK